MAKSALIERVPIADVPEHLAVEGEQFSKARLTDLGREAVAPFVTDVEGPVYALTGRLSPLVATTAMARLSRRGDGFREILADEFLQAPKDSDGAGPAVVGNMTNEAKADETADRVINQFGDDSVKQLGMGSFVVEGASNILTKQLEWGRLASYLEQSTRYIFFDQKDTEGKWGYYIPEQLTPTQHSIYVKTMDRIFDNYSQLVRHIRQHLYDNPPKANVPKDVAFRNAIRAQACDAARLILPAAVKSTVGVVGDAHAIENLIIGLRAGNTPEARLTGDAVHRETSKVLGVFLRKTVDADRGGARTEYKLRVDENMRVVVAGLIEPKAEKREPQARLISVSHADELNALVPEMLFPYSQGWTIEELQNRVLSMTEEEKLRVFNAYIGERLNRRDKPGRGLEVIHYTFDVVCDYGIFRDLQRHRPLDAITWPAITPYVGYEVPRLVIDTGMEEIFHETAMLAENLYELLRELDPYFAQYSVLLGHKMHWTFTMNAREAFHLLELRTGPQGHPGYRKLAANMYEQIAKQHPLLATAMKFINRGEDDELTRLAAEQVQQRKRREMGLEEEALDDI